MKLILGSKSPRRQDLLKELGYSFEIRTKETDESFPLTLPASEVAAYIANKKSEALLDTLSSEEVLLCADTVVTIDNQILGKPADESEAIQMLELLSGKVHEVITGVSIVSQEKNIIFSVHTQVHFYPLSSEIISHYVKHYKPYDKAGSYGIQEWIGHVAVKRLEGSYNNVVGLPTHETYLALKEFQ